MTMSDRDLKDFAAEGVRMLNVQFAGLGLKFVVVSLIDEGEEFRFASASNLPIHKIDQVMRETAEGLHEVVREIAESN